MESQKLKIFQNRLLVADLIIDVLKNKKTVLEALSSFPTDRDDINLKCAFDALVHREADEDLREKTPDYKEVQDKFLLDLAEILKNNEQLPQNIISEYLKYHQDDLISKKSSKFKDFIQYIKRMVNF